MVGRRIVISMPKHTVNAEKKEASNKKRLAALKQKRELARKSKLCIDPSGTASAAQHIVFSSSGDSDDGASGLSSPAATSTPHPGEHTDGGSIRRALFHSDSEGSATEEEDLFASRRQFEGKAGEKLFKLQQKIGVDKRFRLDDRFLDSGGSESDDASEQGASDDLAAQLQQEKSQALSIIDSILGSSKPRIPTPAEHDSNPFPSRYDPTSDTCAVLEQPVTSAKILPDPSEGSGEEEVADTAPDVSKERFFSVSSDLKTLFSNNTKGQTFSFLGSEAEEEGPEEQEGGPEEEGSGPEEKEEGGTGSEEEQAEVDTRLTPRWLHRTSSRPYHREDHTGDDDPAGDGPSSRVLFFFHSTDQQLCNRLAENSFHRRQPLRALEARWAERRAGLKQAYKRRHREAAKLARKKSKYTQS